MPEPMPEERAIRIVPANEASCADLEAIFGTRGDPGRCRCQYFRLTRAEWRAMPVAERAERNRRQAGCGHPGAPATGGLIAYLDDEPVGWCAVEPRTAYPRLRGKRIPWAGRTEDPDDPGIWAVTCFVTRAGFRRRGVSRALARAAVGFARDRGARALEGYAMLVRPGEEVHWGDLFVGSRSVFAAAGFAEVSRPTPRRAVMRVDFTG
jgi:GNAT superfamily N-acetyltransferase